MLNKPQGCVTARSDAVHRTVMDCFPCEIAERLHPVGRLDKDTCGLLILTDDGDLDMRIMQPEKHISKLISSMLSGALMRKGSVSLKTA